MALKCGNPQSPCRRHLAIPIEREFDLTEVAEAHRAWEARELLGRSVIRVGGDL